MPGSQVPKSQDLGSRDLGIPSQGFPGFAMLGSRYPRYSVPNQGAPGHGDARTAGFEDRRIPGVQETLVPVNTILISKVAHGGR